MKHLASVKMLEQLALGHFEKLSCIPVTAIPFVAIAEQYLAHKIAWQERIKHSPALPSILIGIIK